MWGFNELNTVGPRFTTVRVTTVRFTTVSFTTIHFCDACPVGPALPTCGCITVATRASFLYLKALLVLFRCACVSSYSILVQFFEVYFDFSTHDVHQKDRKEENIKTVDVTFCLDIF